jgi:hypothetical protein
MRRALRHPKGIRRLTRKKKSPILIEIRVKSWLYLGDGLNQAFEARSNSNWHGQFFSSP